MINNAIVQFLPMNMNKISMIFSTNAIKYVITKISLNKKNTIEQRQNLLGTFNVDCGNKYCWHWIDDNHNYWLHQLNDLGNVIGDGLNGMRCFRHTKLAF